MTYQIPESIYVHYEIIEKEIMGVTHYGIQRVYKIGPFTFKRMIRVYDDPFRSGVINNSYAFTKWFTDRGVLESAIRRDRSERYDNYVRKMTS